MKINEKGAEDGLFLKNKQMGAEKIIWGTFISGYYFERVLKQLLLASFIAAVNAKMFYPRVKFSSKISDGSCRHSNKTYETFI